MVLANDPVTGKNGSVAMVKLATLPVYTVASAPSAAAHPGRLIRVSNGNAGSPCVALSDGTNWKVIALGATIS